MILLPLKDNIMDFESLLQWHSHYQAETLTEIKTVRQLI